MGFCPCTTLEAFQVVVASRCAPSREVANLVREDPLSWRPWLFFLSMWALLAHHVFLAHRNIPLQSACLQGPQSILNLPVGCRDDHGEGHHCCVYFQTPQGNPSLRQTLRHLGNCEFGKQSCRLCKCHFMNYVIV